MDEKAGLLANGLTDNKDLKYEQTQKTPIKLDELKVRGGELLFEQLSMRANTTLNATMILFSFFSLIFDPPFLGGLSHYIVSFYTILIVLLFII